MVYSQLTPSVPEIGSRLPFLFKKKKEPKLMKNWSEHEKNNGDMFGRTTISFSFIWPQMNVVCEVIKTEIACFFFKLLFLFYFQTYFLYYVYADYAS